MHLPAPTLFAVALAAAASAPTAASADTIAITDLENVDLRAWSQQGLAQAGDWEVLGDGEAVRQNINGAPTLFVSPQDFSNTTLRGSIEVQTGGDDDLIGFVFGYRNPFALSTDPDEPGLRQRDFYLLDWKQRGQAFGGTLAEEGLALTRVLGGIDSSTAFGGSAQEAELLFGHSVDTGPDAGANGVVTDVLATRTGRGQGWLDNTSYAFELTYTDERIGISLGGGQFGEGLTEIFDVSAADAGVDAFQPGRFGFYNYSQSDVLYTGFTRADEPLDRGDGDGGGGDGGGDRPQPPVGVPTPAALPLGLVALAMLASRRRG